MAKPADTVEVPLDLLVGLWRYGLIAPVEGVMYAKSHRELLREADLIIGQAYEQADQDYEKGFIEAANAALDKF